MGSAAPHTGAGLKVKLPARVACKSMDRQKHLAEANRHIAELTIQIVRQRAIVKYALDTPAVRDGGVTAPYARKEPRPIREASRTGSRSAEAPTVRVRGSSTPPTRRVTPRRAGTPQMEVNCFFSGPY